MASRSHILASLLRRSFSQPVIRTCSAHNNQQNSAAPKVRRTTFRNVASRKRVPGVPADRGGALIEDLVVPKSVSPHFTMTGGDEYAQGLDMSQISLALDEFSRRPLVRELAAENGLTSKLFISSYKSFRTYCLSEAGGIDPAVLIVLHDIVKEGHGVDRLFPHFLSHARKVFPHLEAMDDLRMISDLTEPHNWYPEVATTFRREDIGTWSLWMVTLEKVYETMEAYLRLSSVRSPDMLPGEVEA